MSPFMVIELVDGYEIIWLGKAIFEDGDFLDAVKALKPSEPLSIEQGQALFAFLVEVADVEIDGATESLLWIKDRAQWALGFERTVRDALDKW